MYTTPIDRFVENKFRMKGFTAFFRFYIGFYKKTTFIRTFIQKNDSCGTLIVLADIFELNLFKL